MQQRKCLLFVSGDTLMPVHWASIINHMSFSSKKKNKKIPKNPSLMEIEFYASAIDKHLCVLWYLCSESKNARQQQWEYGFTIKTKGCELVRFDVSPERQVAINTAITHISTESGEDCKDLISGWVENLLYLSLFLEYFQSEPRSLSLGDV